MLGGFASNGPPPSEGFFSIFLKPAQLRLNTVAKLWPELGYGFVLGGDGREIYFHRNSVADDAFERLAIGARVAYSEEDGADGPQASRLTLLGS